VTGHRGGKYKLVGRDVIPVYGLLEWAKAYENGKRQIALDMVGSTFVVSTVFLGLDFSHGDSLPRVFETMVFADGDPFYCDRCTTYDEAEAMHRRALNMMVERHNTSAIETAKVVGQLFKNLGET
jgi:hypothetical protein